MPATTSPELQRPLKPCCSGFSGRNDPACRQRRHGRVTIHDRQQCYRQYDDRPRHRAGLGPTSPIVKGGGNNCGIRGQSEPICS